MATYLPGITDAIGAPLLFTPNYDFLVKTLEVSTTRYKTAMDKASKLYGEYFYADLTSEENKKVRDEYFKNVKSTIDNITSMDLSDPRVMEKFRQSIDPIATDKKILADINFTNEWKTQYAGLQSLRGTVPSKDNGFKKYDQELENYLMLKRARYAQKSRSEDEASFFEKVEPVYGVDVREKFFDFAKEYDLNIENITFEESGGRFIVKTKNGDLSTDAYTALAINKFSEDPDVQHYYNLKGKARSEMYLYQTGDNYAAAEQLLDRELLRYSSIIKRDQERLNRMASQTKREMASKQAQLDALLADKNVAEAAKVAKSLEQTKQELSQIEQNRNKLTEYLSGIDKLKEDKAEGIATINRYRAKSGYLSKLMAYKEMYDAASDYALTHVEKEIEADPYSLARLKGGLKRSGGGDGYQLVVDPQNRISVGNSELQLHSLNTVNPKTNKSANAGVSSLVAKGIIGQDYTDRTVIVTDEIEKIVQGGQGKQDTGQGGQQVTEKDRLLDYWESKLGGGDSKGDSNIGDDFLNTVHTIYNQILNRAITPETAPSGESETGQPKEYLGMFKYGDKTYLLRFSPEKDISKSEVRAPLQITRLEEDEAGRLSDLGITPVEIPSSSGTTQTK